MQNPITENDLQIPEQHKRLLEILRRHPGRERAIKTPELYEQFTGEKLRRNRQGLFVDDVHTLARPIRSMVDDLRFLYGIPVMSSNASGYFMLVTKTELESVRHEFMARGLKSMQTAARLGKNSLVDEVHQLALELQDPDSAIVQTVKKSNDKKSRAGQPLFKNDYILSPEARMAAITESLQEMFDNPEQYADQIKALQKQFGPRLISQKAIEALNEQANQVRVLAQQVIDAATRTQCLIAE